MKLEFPAQPTDPQFEVELRSQELLASSFARAGIDMPTDGRFGKSRSFQFLPSP